MLFDVTADKEPPPRNRVTEAELDAVLAACRVLVAVSARSIATVSDVVDLAQFRALVIVGSRKAVSLGELAESAGLNLSTASRMCDRLVGMGLLNRTSDPANRRQLILSPTNDGRRLVRSVTQRRKAAFTPILERLPKARRSELVELLQELAAAGGELSAHDLWSLGWAT